MFGCMAFSSNEGGFPYLKTTGVTVGTEAVDFSLGFRRIPPVGYMTIQVRDAIPTGTTGTLPVRFTLNGNTRVLTSFGGASVTAADLVGTGVIFVWYNYFDGTLQLMAPTV